MIPPPKTTAEDCVSILLFSIVVGLIHHFVTRRARFRAIPEISGAALQLASYYRSPTSFLVSWLPWLLFGLGNIGVSLLRDHGVMIFPWPILINSSLIGVWLYLAQRLHARLGTPSPPSARPPSKLINSQPKANKTDAGNGSYGICRVSNVLSSPSPDPRR